MLALLLFGALFSLLVSFEASERAKRRLPAPPGKPPTRLLTSAAANVTTLDAVPDSTYTKSLCQIAIPIAEEVFTPPLPQGMMRLTFQGSFAIRQDFRDAVWQGMDACFITDHNLNYMTPHKCLVLNRHEVYSGPTESDRAVHRYTFEYESKGGRLGILMKWPFLYPNTKATVGVINLTVTWCNPLDSPARKREEQRTMRALDLATLAHLESNFLDPEYQQDFAASHMGRILDRNKGEWLAEYREVIGDPELYALIEAEHPHVLEWLEARLEVVRIAQRLDVQPSLKPDAPEPKRKETPEEWRARKLRHLRNTAEHKIAKMLERFESARRLREEAEKMGLDEDTIERLENELLGDLEDDEDPGSGFKQL